MLIERLEFFLALARQRHFGRAAEECGVTQPTFSAAIKQLEDALGVMLVQRGSRFLGLTAEGEQVLGWARRIVSDAHAMKEEMRAARRGLSGRIKLAVIPTALPTVAELTTPFSLKHPDVTFSVLSRTSVEVLSALADFDVDAGITYLDNEALGNVVSLPLYTERYRLIVARGNPLAGERQVSWAQVAKLPLCSLTQDMQNRRIIDRHLAEAGARLRPVLESNSMTVLFSHIRTGQWSSVMPLNLAETFGLRERIRAIPIVEPDVRHVVGLVAARREPHTPLVSALLSEASLLTRTARDLSGGDRVGQDAPNLSVIGAATR